MMRIQFVEILPLYVRDMVELTVSQKLYFDSEDDSRSLTGPQVRTNVKKLIAGLKAAGVEKGDCVVLHLFNSVSKDSPRTREFLSRISSISTHVSSSEPLAVVQLLLARTRHIRCSNCPIASSCVRRKL
jgi:hypothetical protein